MYYLIRWHGCETCKPDNRDDTSKGRSLNQKRQHTQKIADYIRSSGYNLVEMWECRWRVYKAASHTIHNRYLYPTETIYRMEERALLSYIEDESIFGAVECDISVPEELKPFFQVYFLIFE